jgi:signal transduction histidine kinase
VADTTATDVLVHVCDDGPGIDPELRDKVFDRFVRGDAARGPGGSGLGLAIAREQARAQGGDVIAGDGPGRGARFTLRLPRAQTAGRERLHQAAPT